MLVFFVLRKDKLNVTKPKVDRARPPRRGIVQWRWKLRGSPRKVGCGNRVDIVLSPSEILRVHMQPSIVFALGMRTAAERIGDDISCQTPPRTEKDHEKQRINALFFRRAVVLRLGRELATQQRYFPSLVQKQTDVVVVVEKQISRVRVFERRLVHPAAAFNRGCAVVARMSMKHFAVVVSFFMPGERVARAIIFDLARGNEEVQWEMLECGWSPIIIPYRELDTALSSSHCHRKLLRGLGSARM